MDSLPNKKEIRLEEEDIARLMYALQTRILLLEKVITEQDRVIQEQRATIEEMRIIDKLKSSPGTPNPMTKSKGEL